MIDLEFETAWLGGHEAEGAERLLEEKGLMIDFPILERRRTFGTQFMNDGLDALERVQQVEFLALQRAMDAAKAVQGLLTEWLRVHDFPAQPARDDFRSWQQ